MTEDITPGLLKKIQEDFQKNFDKSAVISELYKKVRDGTATYKEANEFAIEVGDILANVFKNNLSSDVLPNGRMYYNIAQRIIEPTMKNNYDLITDVTSQIQTSLNKSAKIGIKAIKPELNQDRIHGIVNKVSDAEIYDDVAWVLDEPIRVFSQSIVDDSIKVNAEFQYKAGMSPKIIRTSTGKCCEWCSRLEGVYDYEKVKNTGNEVFKRHQRCRCMVLYNPKDGKGKIQNVHSKKWRNRDDYDRMLLRKSIGLTKTMLKEQFHSLKDPMLEVMGRAIDSHPEEVKQIIKTLEIWNVGINESNALGYGVAFRGDPGIMSVTDDASYAAWLHEFQHVKDAKENGWDAAEVLYENMEERIRRERKAYQLEIDLANSLGYTDVAKRLEGLLDEEIKNIKRFFGSDE